MYDMKYFLITDHILYSMFSFQSILETRLSCNENQYVKNGTCEYFEFRNMFKIVSFVFETEQYVRLEEAEIYAREFLTYVMDRFESCRSCHFKQIRKWVVYVETGRDTTTQQECHRIKLSALLQSLKNYDIDQWFNYEMLTPLCGALECKETFLPIDVVENKSTCLIDFDVKRISLPIQSGRSFEIENILTFVCLSLSLFSILLSMIVYIKCPLFNNLPGQNTFQLMCTLLAAQASFMSGAPVEANTTPCMIIGMVTHWAWLSAFAWMSICSFHTWFVFSKYGVGKLKFESDKKKMFIRYTCLGYGIPTVLIIICFASNFLCKSCNFQYGEITCFISNPTMVAIGFASPILVSIFVNSVLFTATIWNIQRVQTLNTNESTLNRSNVAIYVKLSSLMGLTWIIGFIAEFIRLSWFWYIFTIVNGLQGVFLFVSYVCNDRTVKYIKLNWFGITEKTDTGKENENDKVK